MGYEKIECDILDSLIVIEGHAAIIRNNVAKGDYCELNNELLQAIISLASPLSHKIKDLKIKKG